MKFSEYMQKISKEVSVDDVQNKDYKLVSAPRIRGLDKYVGKSKVFKGHEENLSWGGILIGEPETGNISLEEAAGVVSIKTPEGEYKFKKASDTGAAVGLEMKIVDHSSRSKEFVKKLKDKGIESHFDGEHLFVAPKDWDKATYLIDSWKGIKASKLAGHITESDRFNKKYPKVLALCDKQDELRQTATQALLKLAEGLEKLISMAKAIPEEDYPDKNQRSSEGKAGYIGKIEQNLEKYNEALHILSGYGAS